MFHSSCATLYSLTGRMRCRSIIVYTRYYCRPHRSTSQMRPIATDVLTLRGLCVCVSVGTMSPAKTSEHRTYRDAIWDVDSSEPKELCSKKRVSRSDMELGHWVTGSLGHLSRPGHRVIISTRCETRVFPIFEKSPR